MDVAVVVSVLRVVLVDFALSSVDEIVTGIVVDVLVVSVVSVYSVVILFSTLLCLRDTSLVSAELSLCINPKQTKKQQ